MKILLIHQYFLEKKMVEGLVLMKLQEYGQSLVLKLL